MISAQEKKNSNSCRQGDTDLKRFLREWQRFKEAMPNDHPNWSLEFYVKEDTAPESK